METGDQAPCVAARHGCYTPWVMTASNAKPTRAQLQKAIREHLRKLGARGGRARGLNLTPEQRRRSARHAARARWAKAKRERH